MAAPLFAYNDITSTPAFKTSDTFLQDAYTGLNGYAIGNYLVPHTRESPAKFLNRQQLAVYPNFVRKIVDVYRGFLWRQAPSREVGTLYAGFMADADGLGTPIDALLASYQRLAMLLGTVYVIVDKPQQQGRTLAGQRMPYLVLRLPGQLVSMERDETGKMVSATFSEFADGEPVYRTYTQTGWRLAKDSGGKDIIGQGGHNLGEVPVVPLHVAPPLTPDAHKSQSWVYDLAVLNWDLYNLRSELRELFRAQTFSILSLPVIDHIEREAFKDLTISTENALLFNPTGGGTPGFIAPPADPVRLYMDMIAATVADIYRVANLEFVGGVQQSGVALSFHFQEANSNLRGMADCCNTAELAIARLVHLWQGQTFTGTISYANDFNLTDLQQALATTMDAVTLGMGAEFDKAIKKRLAKQLLGNEVAPDDMAAIDQEIDAQGDPYGDRLQQQADAQPDLPVNGQ